MTLPPKAVAAVSIVLLALAVWLGAWAASRWRRLRAAWRMALGRGAEKAAEAWLKREGFAIVEAQARRRVEFTVDGAPESAEVFADYIVEKEGVEYLVEVKAGETAPDPAYPPTRRQMLEYALAFGNRNLILLDMEAEEMHRIEFPSLEPRGASLPWRWLAGAFAAGLASGLWLFLRFLRK